MPRHPGAPSGAALPARVHAAVANCTTLSSKLHASPARVHSRCWYVPWCGSGALLWLGPVDSSWGCAQHRDGEHTWCGCGVVSFVFLFFVCCRPFPRHFHDPSKPHDCPVRGCLHAVVWERCATSQPSQWLVPIGLTPPPPLRVLHGIRRFAGQGQQIQTPAKACRWLQRTCAVWSGVLFAFTCGGCGATSILCCVLVVPTSLSRRMGENVNCSRWFDVWWRVCASMLHGAKRSRPACFLTPCCCARKLQAVHVITMVRDAFGWFLDVLLFCVVLLWSHSLLAVGT